jgi:hypothetical protein
MHRKILTSSLIAGVALCVAGCSAIIVQAYAPPTGPDTSGISFTNDGYREMSVFFYKGAERCTQRMGRLPITDGKLVTSIPTGKPVAFSVVGIVRTTGIPGGQSIEYCQTSVSMTADASRKYLVSIRPTADMPCGVAISDYPVSGTEPGRPTAVQIHETIPAGQVLTEAGPFCKPA